MIAPGTCPVNRSPLFRIGFEAVRLSAKKKGRYTCFCSPELGGKLCSTSLGELALVQDAPPSRPPIRFGVFELDAETVELRKQGVKVKLQEQPFRVLQVLLERPGKVVTREELQRRIWPSDTFVDFDQGLYNATKKLREVLGDSAESPRFIETVPRRGYRFIGTVEGNGHAALPATLSEAAKPAPSRNLRLGIALLTSVVAIGSLVAGGRLWRRLWGPNSAPTVRSIAVLPLQNLSGDPNQEYFSDGMTDALITALAQMDSLKVISRTSSMQYKQTNKSLPEIARELNVDAIIEGTVQRSGDRVRITAQLIQASTDKHVWANSYERQLQDLFGLEQDVAADIARQVQAQVGTTHPPARSVDSRVLDAYIMGNYHLNGVGRGAGDQELKIAREYFQQAISLDPDFAPAYVGIARSHDPILQAGPEDLILMRQAAEKALQLDPSSSAAQVALAMAKSDSWNWSGGEQDYRRAVELRPNDADAHFWLGGLLDDLGRLDEGWKEFQIAQELDPNQDRLSEALYRRRQFDQVVSILERIVKRDPSDGYHHYFLAMSYAQKGMYREFAVTMDTLYTLYELPGVGRLRRAYEQSGREGVLKEFAKSLEELAAARQLYFPGLIAQTYAALGNKDRAFHWLEEYRNHHELALADPTGGFKTDPGWDPLRSDPRFADFLRRVGLSP